MLTAILPICIKQNPFWSSSQGLKCIETFIALCTQISEVKKFIVVTQDKVVCDLAIKYNMDVNKTYIHNHIDQQYSYEQIFILGKHFIEHYKTKSDALLVLDHRNLFLTIDDIKKAISLYRMNSGTGVISLAFCKDYPCQYKSFYNFIDCMTFNLDHHDEKGRYSDASQAHLSNERRCKLKEFGEICVNVSVDSFHCKISFRSKNQVFNGYVAQIVPFGLTGPYYEQFQEIYVPTSEYDALFEIKTSKSIGIIVILISPSLSGEYDSVEIFTPKNATWKLSETGTSIIDTKKNEPMFGRQQFPITYTYDGSLSIFGQNQIKEESTTNNTIPMILNESILVTDWFDYLNSKIV